MPVVRPLSIFANFLPLEKVSNYSRVSHTVREIQAYIILLQKGVSVVTTSVLKATTTSKFHVRNIATPVPTTLVPTTQALIRRALVKAQPLADPSDYKGNQERFIETVFLKGKGVESEAIYITPSDNQKANWKIPLTIDDKTVETPIGATAQWFPFGKEPQVWRIVSNIQLFTIIGYAPDY